MNARKLLRRRCVALLPLPRQRGALRLGAIVSLAAGLLLIVTVRMAAVQPDGAARVNSIAAAISERLEARTPPTVGRVDVDEWEALARLYRASEHTPLWTNAGRPNGQAREAIALLAHASVDGLDPRDYAVDDLEMTEASLAGAPTPRVEDSANFDVAMSASVLRYLKHVHLGRVDPRTLGFQLVLPAESHDFVSVLQSALARNQLLDAATKLQPSLVQYRALRDALARYRALAQSVTFDPLPAGVVRPGDHYAGLPALVQRLIVLGDLATDDTALPTGIRYDGPLVEAVERFQLRHGLSPDGVVGSASRAALEVPLHERVRQLELALERLRWLPDFTHGRVLVLNIPMFRFWGSEAPRPSGPPAIEMRAVVGRAMTSQTPVLVEEMRYVVFRPYWNVPRSIVRNEILPALARDPTYLSRQNMEIVRGAGDDGAVVDATGENVALLRRGILRLRQRPGPGNALGLVKFMFPNDASVYMHGTPAQELFGRTRRDFSHGCVRVEDPVALAEWVLRDQPEWTRTRIIAAMSGDRPQHVDLAHPIQVVFFYSTAGVMRDSSVHFANDIYGHDAQLDRALARGDIDRPALRLSGTL